LSLKEKKKPQRAIPVSHLYTTTYIYSDRSSRSIVEMSKFFYRCTKDL